MKNKHFWLLSLAALLAVSACGGQKKSNNDSANSDEPSEQPYSYVEPEVDLVDIATANIEIDFDEIEDNCMINPQAHDYVDQMKIQEKTLDKPYQFSSLYGPDDYRVIAAAADKGDGVTYDAADTGGVDVCQILNRTDYNNTNKNYPINLTWDDDGSYNDAIVKFWSTEDQSDLRETGVTVKNGKVTAELSNLFRAKKYRFQVINGSDVSQGYEFTTGDYPRQMSMGNISNVRDLGGYITSYGVRTNQGLIYRGGYIEDKNGGHGINYTAEAGKVHEEVMNIGMEIDLQTTGEINGRTTSCLVGADYQCLTLVSYDSFLKKDSYKNLPAVMKLIANSDEEHSYFHCWGGADRTGMLAFFINAILGVSYTDLIIDFELTTQTNNKRCHMHNSTYAHFPKFLNEFINNWDDYDEDATVNENCEKWMIDVAEVDPDDIERIREIMLPGYADGELEQNKLIREYTAEEEWQRDDLAHWHVAKEDSNVKCNWARHDGATCSICGHGEQSGGEENNSSNPASETEDPLTPFVRVWSVSKKENNSDGKEYEHINDASRNKVGVRILFENYSSDSTATVSSGKLDPVNDHSVYLLYRIKAPKAGTYQLVMNGRVSDDTKTLTERNLFVNVNGVDVDIQGDRTAGLGGQGDNDFVAAPVVSLTGNEDVIKIGCADYRIAFNVSSYLTFAEH